MASDAQERSVADTLKDPTGSVRYRWVDWGYGTRYARIWRDAYGNGWSEMGWDGRWGKPQGMDNECLQ